MLFNSLSFLLVFLPVSLVVFYSLGFANKSWKTIWLVVVSFVFYSWWSNGLIVLLSGSILFNYSFGLLINRPGNSDSTKNAFLATGIAGDLLLLFYYKYAFPLLNWICSLGIFQTPDHPYTLALPLGISFFTFTQIGYLIDCRAGLVQSAKFIDYCLFVTFFPHLIAGPILHHKEILPQFASPKAFRLESQNLAVGFTLFFIGLAKKDLIADHFALIANPIFNSASDSTFYFSWIGALSYSLQLYFDFSGYSDMAIGLARMFGIKFPANFDSPYCATSIIEFWQRWHMTLTRYITLYLYNPISLSISRYRVAHGKDISRQALKTADGFLSLIVVPTLITMTLAGIWHGAGLQFVIFGTLHGVYIIINHAYALFIRHRLPAITGFTLFPTMAQVLATFLAVLVSEVFFRANSVDDALTVLTAMCNLTPSANEAASELIINEDLIQIAACFFIVWTCPNSLQILRNYEPTVTKLRSKPLFAFAWAPTPFWAIATAILAFFAFIWVAGITDFIYFRF